MQWDRAGDMLTFPPSGTVLCRYPQSVLDHRARRVIEENFATGGPDSDFPTFCIFDDGDGRSIPSFTALPTCPPPSLISEMMTPIPSDRYLRFLAARFSTKIPCESPS